MIAQITRVCTRTYTDSGQTTTYVEWVDQRGRNGRTEGNADNPHMQSLITRGAREGSAHRVEIW